MEAQICGLKGALRSPSMLRSKDQIRKYATTGSIFCSRHEPTRSLATARAQRRRHYAQVADVLPLPEDDKRERVVVLGSGWGGKHSVTETLALVTDQA